MENKPSVLTDRYEVGRLLGQGHFAKVYFGRTVHTNVSVAIKMIDKDKVIRYGISDQIKREISVMRIVKHPNVVELHEVIATKSRIFLVLEYCKGGEVFHKIKKGKLREEVAWKYFYQLINAVDFMHSRGVYHRDIKLENLLLDDHDNLKVADFGLSAVEECKGPDGLLHTGCGTHAYLSPEIISHKGYDGVKSDIWSCGVVLFALLVGYLPFYDTSRTEMYRKIGKALFKCPRGFPAEAKRILYKMLDPYHETRATMARIKESAWYRKGVHLKHKKQVLKDTNLLEVGEGSGENQKLPQFLPLNAFDIIRLSLWFDFSGLFGDVYDKQETRFTSLKPVSEIISKLEEVSKSLKLNIRKKDAGLFKLEWSKEGRRGFLSIDAKIFQVTQTFHLVEVKKCHGDTIEYQKLVKEVLRPALADIVCVWEGEKAEEEQYLPRILENDQEEEKPSSSSATVVET